MSGRWVEGGGRGEGKREEEGTGWEEEGRTRRGRAGIRGRCSSGNILHLHNIVRLVQREREGRGSAPKAFPAGNPIANRKNTCIEPIHATWLGVCPRKYTCYKTQNTKHKTTLSLAKSFSTQQEEEEEKEDGGGGGGGWGGGGTYGVKVLVYAEGLDCAECYPHYHQATNQG